MDPIIAVEKLEWRDLQGEMVAHSAIALIVCAWAAWWYVMAQPQIRLDLVALTVAVIVGGLVVWSQARRYRQIAALALVGTTFVATAIAYAAFELPQAGYFFVVPMLLAGIVLQAWSVPALMVIVSIFLYLAVPDTQPAVWQDPGVLVVILALFQTLGMAALRTALDRAWRHSAQAVALATEARTQRGEVNRLNKALHLANSLLQRQYQELAVARHEAEKARHLKEQFAIHVSHELRTPLNIILGFLEVMQRFPEVYGDVQWTSALRRDIAEIQRSARYLSDLVDDILDLARIEALKMPVHRELASLEEVLNEAVELASRLVQDRPVEVRVIVPEPLPALFIDRTRVRQVLLNLLANASRFTAHGEICVRAVREQDEIIVSVSDTGAGIPAEQLGTLFAEFQQVTSQPASGRGKGLGLAIAKRFVEMHGGRIWAESQVGRGSTFYFSLPVVAKQVGFLVPASATEERPTGEHSTLVVVDPNGGAAYLRRRLEGFEVLAAPDLEQARAMVRERHPDALLLNVPPDAEGATQGMPPSILAEGVPLLQCSLPVGSWLIERELFNDWLVKPISGERLLQIIERYCPRGNLLVVDDDRGFVQLIRRILQADGDRFRVQWAYSAEEALAKLQTQAVDLLLLDIALPGPDGRTIAQVLRGDANMAQVPIVAVSASPPGSESARGHPCTFAVTRHGGFSEDELLSLIQNTLRDIKPRYAAAPLASAFPATPAEILAS